MSTRLPPTAKLKLHTVFTRAVKEGEQGVYPGVNIRLPFSLSPWDACSVFMEKGYLPPFELVRQLAEEEVSYGDIARRLWVLRGARRTARVVQESSLLTLRQVHQLKKKVQGWRTAGVESNLEG